MITSNRFIAITNICEGKPEIDYVNIDYIVRLYQDDNDVVVKLSDGTTMLVLDTNVHVLLDKLNVSNQLHIYNK